jgi:nucleotide-binding universal stress UspA family protein
MNTNAFTPTFLLPIDGSAHAEGAARHLARRAALLHGSHIVVLYVENDHLPAGQPRMPAEQAVRNATAVLDQAGVRVEVRYLAGEPAETILRCAEDLPAGEIVMGSRGLGRWSGLVIGSVAMKIVQHAAMPVTVVGTFAGSDGTLKAGADLDHLLLASDGSRPSVRATEYVCALHAARLPVQVELTAVVGPIPPAWLQENITPEKLEFYYQQEGNRMLFESRALLENAAVPTRNRIEVGFVADKLIQAAAATGCTRMVLGCRGRTGLSGLLLGSVAYQAMHLSLIPVTLVK